MRGVGVVLWIAVVVCFIQVAKGASCTPNNGGCDPRTTCTNSTGSIVCGACPTGFSGTGASGCSVGDYASANLVLNPSCSGTLVNWDNTNTRTWECTPRTGGYVIEGAYTFWPAATPLSFLQQVVSLTSHASLIDTGLANFTTSVYYRSYPQTPVDYGRFVVNFLALNGTSLRKLDTGDVTSPNAFIVLGGNFIAPIGTRSAVIQLWCRRYNGGNCDAYYDVVSLKVVSNVNTCTAKNGGCDPLTTCTYVAGSGARCGPCPAGYSGTGATNCTEIDECATNNGGCATTCHNTVGSYYCGPCPAGSIGTNTIGCDVPYKTANLVRNGNCDNAVMAGWETDYADSWSCRSDARAYPGSTYTFFPLIIAYTELYQTIDVSAHSIAIDSGLGWFEFSAFTTNFDQSPPDQSQIKLTFYGANGSKRSTVIDSWDTGAFASQGVWTTVKHTTRAISGTRSVIVTIACTRYYGQNCDAYYNGITLNFNTNTCSNCSTIGSIAESCDGPSQCTCHPGFTGPTCSEFACEGCNNVGATGKCSGPLQCECKTGYAGTYCNNSQQVTPNIYYDSFPRSADTDCSCADGLFLSPTLRSSIYLYFDKMEFTVTPTSYNGSSILCRVGGHIFTSSLINGTFTCPLFYSESSKLSIEISVDGGSTYYLLDDVRVNRPGEVATTFNQITDNSFAIGWSNVFGAVVDVIVYVEYSGTGVAQPHYFNSVSNTGTISVTLPLSSRVIGYRIIRKGSGGVSGISVISVLVSGICNWAYCGPRQDCIEQPTGFSANPLNVIDAVCKRQDECYENVVNGVNGYSYSNCDNLFITELKDATSSCETSQCISDKASYGVPAQNWYNNYYIHRLFALYSSRGSANVGFAWGDPHYVTFTNCKYDFMGEGDFILSKIDDVNTQTTTTVIVRERGTNGHRGTTFQSLALIQIEDPFTTTTVQVTANGRYGTVIINNDYYFTHARTADYVIFDKGSLRMNPKNGIFTFTLTNGVEVQVRTAYIKNRVRAVYVTVPQRLAPIVNGLLGKTTTSNFVSPTGTVMQTCAAKTTTTTYSFGNMWKVQNSRVIGNGICPVLKCPMASPVTKPTFTSPQQESEANAACADIDDVDLREACVYDYVVVGEEHAVSTTKTIKKAVAVKSLALTVTASVAENKTVLVNWNTISGYSNYRMQIARYGSSVWDDVIEETTVNTFGIVGLQSGSYTARVAASEEDNLSAWSNSDVFTIKSNATTPTATNTNTPPQTIEFSCGPNSAPNSDNTACVCKSGYSGTGCSVAPDLCSGIEPGSLKTDNYPVLSPSDNGFTANSLEVSIISDYVIGRSFTKVENSDATDEKCSLSLNGYWSKSFTGCKDHIKLVLPWESHGVCGFVPNTQNLNSQVDSYVGGVLVTYEDQVAAGPSYVIRQTTVPYTIYVNFPNTITVSLTNLVVNSTVDLTALLTKFSYSTATGLLSLQLTTILGWPNMLIAPLNVVTPVGLNFVSSPAAVGTVSCTNTQNTDCVQTLDFQVSRDALTTCDFSGQYTARVNVTTCRDTQCTFAETTLTFHISTSDICGEVGANPTISGVLTAHENASFITPQNPKPKFTVGSYGFLHADLNTNANTVSLTFVDISFDDGTGAKNLLTNKQLTPLGTNAQVTVNDQDFYFSVYFLASVFSVPVLEERQFTFSANCDVVFSGNSKKSVKFVWGAEAVKVNAQVALYQNEQNAEVKTVGQEEVSPTLSVGAIVGIVIGGVVITTLLIGFLVYKKTKNHRKLEATPSANASAQI